MSWDPLQREILAALEHVVYAVDGSDAVGVPEPPTLAAAAPAQGIDPLMRALLRAAGREAGDAEALALCRSLLPPGGLRDAAARRALWPRLRGLRAGPAR